MGSYVPVTKKYYEKQKLERLGETKLCHQGLLMKIIIYNSAQDIYVEFEDGHVTHTNYKAFKLGNVKNPNFKLQRFMPEKENRVGETRISNEGYEMYISEYHNANHIVVKFNDEYKTEVTTAYKCFRNGGVKNPNRIGRYGERTGNIYPTKNPDGTKTKEYNTWRGILTRVFNYAKYSRTHIYKDVDIAPEWLYFPNFYEWLHSQENYSLWEGKEWCIDKDILSTDGKKYSPDTCCLIPQSLNAAILSLKQKSKKGLPIGVRKSGNGYLTQIDESNKKHFNSMEEAEEAYEMYKINHIKMLAEKYYKNKEITKRCYDGLQNYSCFIK